MIGRPLTKMISLAVLAAATLLPAAVAPALATAVPSSAVLSEFDNAADWQVGSGVASTAEATSPKTSGSGSLRVNYDMSASSSVTIVPTGTPAELPGIPRHMWMDVYGDGSWNVLYYEIRDSTGEILRYWLGNLSSTGWQTFTLDLSSAKPVSSRNGNLDGVLDLPASLSQIVIYLNPGATKKSGTVYLDRLSYDYDPTGLAAGTPTFVPSAGQSSVVTLSLADQGTFNLRLLDEAGHTRTYTGSAGNGSVWSTTWNGRDDSNAVMTGSVRALLAITRGSTTQSVQWPYFAGLPARVAGANASQRGINSFLTTVDTVDRAIAASQAAAMESAYVGMAREEFEWKRVEPSNGVYDWPKFDQAVDLLQAHGITVLGKLAYGSPWDNTAPSGTPASAAVFYPPSSIQGYVDYAVATVHRYKDRVHVWEIWNEENNPAYWLPSPSAAQYTQLLKATYAAIKAEDPTATVVLGGLSTGPDAAYLQGIHDNGGWGSFDVLAFHAFMNGAPDANGSILPLWFANAKSTVAAWGAKPIWITEFGWSTFSGAGSVSTGDQSLYLMRTYEMASQAGISGMFWFDLKNGATNTGDVSQNYGILYADGSQKPAFSGFQCDAKALYLGSAPTCSSPVYPKSTYHAVAPTRVLDTRNGTGGISGPFTNHHARSFTVPGLPSNAVAVTGNLTVTQASAGGFLYIGPMASDFPASSTLNFPAGDDRANAVTVALGAGNNLAITYVAPSDGPTAQAIFDLTGYFTADTGGATYHAVSPTRVLDSRFGKGGISSAFTNHHAQTFTVPGLPSNVVAVTGDLTVTGATGGGFLYVGPSAADNPASSTLSFPAGDDRANAVTVQIGSGNNLSITYVASHDGPTAQAIFDLTGYFTSDATGSSYVAVSPTRVLDSRVGTGGISRAFTNHAAQSFAVPGLPTGVVAVTGNLTVTQASSGGYLYIGPVAADNPASSTLNFPAGDDRANSVDVALGSGNNVSITFVAPHDGPTAQALFDLTGYFAP